MSINQEQCSTCGAGSTTFRGEAGQPICGWCYGGQS